MNRRASVAVGACVGLVWMACAPVQPKPGPRVAPLAENAWTAEVHAAATASSPVGMGNLVATYANYPALATVLLPHLHYIWTESTLPERDRALLSLRTLWLARSDYLWAHRAALARSEGLADADFTRIARGPGADGWSAFESTLLGAADELYVDAFISDTTWAALGERYDLRQLIDTIDTVGALTMNAGAVNTLRVAIESGVEERRPTQIPYSVAAERTNIRLVGKAPRIPPKIPADASFAANVFYTFRHYPPADSVRGAINTRVTGRSTLDPLYREFLLVRIGTLCRSEYEFAAHLRAGRRAGMTDEDLALILAGSENGKGDPVKLALLEATDELYRDTFVSDATWKELADAFDTKQLLDVLIVVGGYRSTSMLINTAGVQLDDNMADFRFPPSMR
jgi:4-carboxymuconolactone decarboxylase